MFNFIFYFCVFFFSLNFLAALQEQEHIKNADSDQFWDTVERYRPANTRSDDLALDPRLGEGVYALERAAMKNEEQVQEAALVVQLQSVLIANQRHFFECLKSILYLAHQHERWFLEQDLREENSPIPYWNSEALTILQKLLDLPFDRIEVVAHRAQTQFPHPASLLAIRYFIETQF